jgi:hypothetical protein
VPHPLPVLQRVGCKKRIDLVSKDDRWRFGAKRHNEME